MELAAHSVAPRHASTLPTSHGDEADILRSGRYANRLSHLASSTALYLLVLARKGRVAGVEGLERDAVAFCGQLREIVVGHDRPERDLPVRQLVPVRVWRDARLEADDIGGFAQRLEDALAGRLDATELEEMSRDLEEKARVLDNEAGRSLHSVGY